MDWFTIFMTAYASVSLGTFIFCVHLLIQRKF